MRGPRQLTEGAGFFWAAPPGCGYFKFLNSIRKLKTNPVNLASDDVLEGADIHENVHERGVLTSGRHVETGPVRAQRLMAVREGRVFLEAPVFVVWRDASVRLAVP
jgi:hypothetical protein